MGTIPTPPDPDAGGWISGGMPIAQYNPAVLVDDVARMLRAKGLQFAVDEQTALLAAGDLLRALGVMPASSPMNGRMGT